MIAEVRWASKRTIQQNDKLTKFSKLLSQPTLLWKIIQCSVNNVFPVSKVMTPELGVGGGGLMGGERATVDTPPPQRNMSVLQI